MASLLCPLSAIKLFIELTRPKTADVQILDWPKIGVPLKG
jgi:hypothetical protein